ncbi:MAG: hypothetical protein JSS81_24600 [Acidobacteria bacterium]|nr:hypothetical protein [Acidobacteriota bacterium]
MAETFKCPSCSAPLEFEGRPMQKCRFCGSNVIVPASVVQGSPHFGGVGNLDFGDLSALKGKALKIAEIQNLLRNGRKIEAIKVFRETFGTGLKEAKDAVDAMERGQGFDLSGMQVVTQTSATHFSSNAQNLETAKKIGYTVGGSILGTFLIVALLIVGVIALAFYLISRTINNVIDKPNVTRTTPSTPPKNSPVPPVSLTQQLLKFGGEGTGAGKFKDNRTVAVDQDGRIYSADYSGGRIQVFDAAGNFQTQITTDTTRTVDALAVDRKGNLFVLQGYDVYRVAAATGETLGKYRVDSASGMALGLDGKLYVATRYDGITVLNGDGTKVRTMPLGKDLNIDQIEKIAIDGTGSLFLIDRQNSAVFKLSPEGRLLTRFGGKERRADDSRTRDQFDTPPMSIAVDSRGRVYVSQLSRISVFDGDGRFLNDFSVNQVFGMAFNDSDEMFVAARPYVIKYKLNF